MKLLFDHNLSPRLVRRLSDIFPDSSHVSFHAMDAVDDTVVWKFAKDNDFVLVTKDSDFSDLSTLHGFPPKVLWLKIGNCTTNQIENMIRLSQEAIQQLETDSSIGVLELQ